MYENRRYDVGHLHKKVAEVIDKQLVVDVVVRSCAEPNLPESVVPGEYVLGVNQAQPVRIQRAEGHVRPHIGVDEPCSEEKGNQNHEEGVRR